MIKHHCLSTYVAFVTLLTISVSQYSLTTLFFIFTSTIHSLQNAQLLGEVGVDESKVVQVFLRPLPPNTTATTATVTAKAINTTVAATATATVADTTTTTITPTTVTIIDAPSPAEDDHTVAAPSEILTAPTQIPSQNPTQIIDPELVPTTNTDTTLTASAVGVALVSV